MRPLQWSRHKMAITASTRVTSLGIDEKVNAQKRQVTCPFIFPLSGKARS